MIFLLRFKKFEAKRAQSSQTTVSFFTIQWEGAMRTLDKGQTQAIPVK